MIHDLSNKHCKPCEGGALPLSELGEDSLHAEVPVWKLERMGVHNIQREFKFAGFAEAMRFVGAVAMAAAYEGHHPEIIISYNKVTIILSTRAIKGLSRNDFIMAAKIDQIYRQSA